MSRHADTDPRMLRNLAATLTTLTGTGQCLALWLLPTTPTLLGTALTGSLYLLLALGLFGMSRLSLLLAIALPPLRSWFGVFPLPTDSWEFLRIACDLVIALLCVSPLWVSLGPEQLSPGPDAGSEQSENA